MNPPRTRREALLLGGSVLSLLAGCTAPSGDAPQSSETPGATTPTTETPNGADVAIERVRVAPAVDAPNSPDSIGTVGERGEQFVLVEVATDGTPPAGDEFSLAVDGEPHESPVDGGYVRENGLWDYGDGRTVPEDLLVFSAPNPFDAASVDSGGPTARRR